MTCHMHNVIGVSGRGRITGLRSYYIHDVVLFPLVMDKKHRGQLLAQCLTTQISFGSIMYSCMVCQRADVGRPSTKDGKVGV